MTLELTDLPTLRKSAFTLKYYFRGSQIKPGIVRSNRTLKGESSRSKRGARRSDVDEAFEPVFPVIVCGAENRAGTSGLF